MNYQVNIKSARFRCCCYVTAPSTAAAMIRAIAHTAADNPGFFEELGTAKIKVRNLPRGEDTILYEQLEREGRI